MRGQLSEKICQPFVPTIRVRKSFGKLKILRKILNKVEGDLTKFFILNTVSRGILGMSLSHKRIPWRFK